MAGWHSLSGYLYYRPGGAFGRIKPKKRYWYVFDDSQGKLLCFKNANEAKKSKPTDSVDIKDATISLSLDQNNQFIVSIEGKEFYLTADNHESMMIWLLGLQAKRDSYVKRALRESSSDSVSDGEACGRERSLSESKSLVNDMETTHSSVVRCSSMRERRDVFRLRFQRFGTIDTGYGEERQFAVPPLLSPDAHSLTAPSFQLTSSASSASRKWSSGASGESDDAFLHTEDAGIAREGRHRQGSERSASGSSDSAIDSDRRVTELERELMKVKAELACSLNQESKLREALERKDAARLEVVQEVTADNEKGKSSKPDAKLQEKTRVLQNQNRFLNEEVKKLGNLRQLEREKFQDQEKKIHCLEAEIDQWKRDYLFVLQSTIRMPDGDLVEEYEVKLYGGDRHQVRLRQLLDEAHKSNPSLPSYDRLQEGEAHIDSYGFKQRPENDSLIQHFVCTQLYQHYCHQLQSYEQHQQAWRDYLKLHRHSLTKTKELKTLCRAGIPPQHRAEVWTQLIYNQVQDLVKTKGPHYYQNVCNMMPDSVNANRYLRQISLDLMRTMPNNIHFSSPTSDGIKKMREVLQAFCVHNPQLGYCQGMNFIVGMALLFMEAEDAFWTLVAITEKYFSPNYFDHNLVGAQADQEVLKEFLREKLPQLWQHLEELDIEISTVTLNWFLPIFFDAVPFETLLRIWDCFLLEGPKVLFRFALAILKIHESSVVQKTETISIMRHLKACAKLTFDIEGLVKTAFEDLNPFPRRKDITSKQAYYVNILKEKVKKREKQQRAFLERERMFEDLDLYSPGKRALIECAVQFQEGKLWVFHGNQLSSRVAEVRCHKGFMYDINIEFDTRVLCACALSPEVVLVGTLSQSLFAYCTRSRVQLWHVRLNDAIFALRVMDEQDRQKKIFAALADGTVAVLEKLSSSDSAQYEVFYIPVGQGPVTSMLLIDKQLWCATGNMVHILHAVTLDPMDNFVVSTNPYDHILTLAMSQYGVWIAIKGSSIIELWDNRLLTCMMFFDVKDNRYPNLRKEDCCYFNGSRITAVLPIDHAVWIGTGDGNLLLYDVIDKEGVFHSKAATPHSDSNLSSPYYTSCGQVVKDLRTLHQVGHKVEELYYQRLEEQKTNRLSPRCSLGGGVENSRFPQLGAPTRQAISDSALDQSSRMRKISRDSGVTVIWNNPAFCDKDMEENLTPKLCSSSENRLEHFTFDLSEFNGQKFDKVRKDDTPYQSGLKKLKENNESDDVKDSSYEYYSDCDRVTQHINGDCKLSPTTYKKDLSHSGVIKRKEDKNNDCTKFVHDASNGSSVSRQQNGANCNSGASEEVDTEEGQAAGFLSHSQKATNTCASEQELEEVEGRVRDEQAEDFQGETDLEKDAERFQMEACAKKQGKCNGSEKGLCTKERDLASYTAEEGIQAAYHMEQYEGKQGVMISDSDFDTGNEEIHGNQMLSKLDHSARQSIINDNKNRESQSQAEETHQPSLKEIILEAIRQHERCENLLWSEHCSLTTSSVPVRSFQTEESVVRKHSDNLDHLGQGQGSAGNSSESTDPNSSETVVPAFYSRSLKKKSTGVEDVVDVVISESIDLHNSSYRDTDPKPDEKSRSSSEVTDIDLDGSARRSRTDSDFTDLEARIESQKLLKKPSLQWDHNIGDEEGFISMETATDNETSFTDFATKEEKFDNGLISFEVGEGGEEQAEDSSSGVIINVEDFDNLPVTLNHTLTHTSSSPAILSTNSILQQDGDSPLEKRDLPISPQASRRTASSSGRQMGTNGNMLGCHSRQMSLDTNASSVFWSSEEERGSTGSLKEGEDTDGVVRRSSVSGFSRRLSSISVASAYSTISTNEVPYLFDLSLQARVKVADKPIRAVLRTRCSGEPVIVSCAGCYGDDESVLKWTKEEGEKMWTNEPFMEICPITSSPKRPVYMFNKPFSPKNSIRSESDLSSYEIIQLGSSPEKHVSFHPEEKSADHQFY
ncbi:uncharacterized protein LOC106174987 isoform X2 [Lingula anatina]|uniref:Uncharacterized protein LOC106174987 isoform X2 n=1 Tax=Lingula anatina TaxID=7574 RepID=A0A1S3JPE3_LINAN|nr:uncharacterized protein LOC106174987 isoform X2 [Lingula anatina]|eukprot:XP_013412235.1 uncharacterized protein LOC106174987 isoform X2 [Lingula anatina]